VIPAVRSAQIADAQKQYLSIEAVAVSQAVDVLALPGRVTFRPQAQSAIGHDGGRVVAVLVQAGQVVKAGTELLTIESADAGTARATLDQAATRLAAPRASSGARSRWWKKASAWSSSDRSRARRRKRGGI